MRLDKIIHTRFYHQKTEHWKDMDELHEVLHSLPNYFKALTFELLEKPMSRQALRESLRHLEMRMGRHHRREFEKIDLDKDIAAAIERGVLEEKDGKIFLTHGGREIAEHMQLTIPFFVGTLFSAKVVSIVTIAVHVLLSILKLTFGLISGSAGLIADGIDNTMDTVSSVLVWLGIKYDRDRLVSLFIVVMMFVSVGGVALASYNKIVHPGPVEQGLSAFIVSALCGLLMLLLSAYQYMTGKKSSNFAILCQSVDSRNHFLTSLLVCAGIVLSSLALTFHTFWLYYADAVASIIIGLLILVSAIELSRELVKQGEGPTHVSHFMRRAQERIRANIIIDWLSEQLKETPLNQEQLEERFAEQFCEQSPKILVLSGMGYRPESSADLHRYLDHFVRGKKLALRDGVYMLSTTELYESIE